MPRCVNHPGRASTQAVFGQDYCAQCCTAMEDARGRVDRHVEPKECFIWYLGHGDWQPITGTGCAHWVSHQLGVKVGPRGARCLAGYTFRVPLLPQGRRRITDLAEVRVNDLYVTPAQDHMGLVIRVTPSTAAGQAPAITIRHDSSRQGRVAENEFATYFHGMGAFYR